MGKEFFNELSILGRDGMTQHSYFQLTAVGASIGFIATQTKSVFLSWWTTPVLMSGFCLGLSFLCGTLYLRSRIRAYQLEANIERWKKKWKESGEEKYKELSDDFLLRQKPMVLKCLKYAKWQTWFLCMGVFMFCVWHILEMWHRTPENICLWL